MLQLLYIIAFTILAILAVSNLVRNLVSLSADSQRRYSPSGQPRRYPYGYQAPHPELLDDSGNVINEPLIVMRSMSVEDARKQLDAIYKASPGNEEAGGQA